MNLLTWSLKQNVQLHVMVANGMMNLVGRVSMVIVNMWMILQIVDVVNFKEEEMARVKVIGEPTGIPTHVFVDGEEIHRVKGISFNLSEGNLPTFSIDMSGAPEIELDGRIEFSFSPRTVEESVKVLRHTLMTDNNLYKGLVASIESALRESTVVWEEWEYTETAKKIADRIIGKG